MVGEKTLIRRSPTGEGTMKEQVLVHVLAVIGMVLLVGGNYT